MRPYGVFCLIAKVFATEGIELFIPVLAYVVTLTTALFVHLFVTLMIILKLLSGLNPLTFHHQDPAGADLRLFDRQLERHHSRHLWLRDQADRASTIRSPPSPCPLGATINMDGTAIMQGVATVFLATFTASNWAWRLSDRHRHVGSGLDRDRRRAGVGLVMLTMVLTQVGLPDRGDRPDPGRGPADGHDPHGGEHHRRCGGQHHRRQIRGQLDIAVHNDPECRRMNDGDLEIDPEARGEAGRTGPGG